MLKTTLNGVHTELGDDIKKYVDRKIGRLDRFLSRHARESAHAEVYLKESKVKSKKQNTCEVVVKLPGETITVKETTINMFAAVDIVEAKLKNLLKKYNETHGKQAIHKRVLARMRRRTDSPESV